jgi:hypothetical protein
MMLGFVPQSNLQDQAIALIPFVFALLFSLPNDYLLNQR